MHNWILTAGLYFTGSFSKIVEIEEPIPAAVDELECQVIMNDVQFYAHTSALVYEGAKTRIIAHGGFGESSGHCRQNYLRVYDLTNSGIELPF